MFKWNLLSLRFCKSCLALPDDLTGLQTVCKVLFGAINAARRLWRQWRGRNTFYGGGYCGHSALLDKCGQPQGSFFILKTKHLHNLFLCCTIIHKQLKMVCQGNTRDEVLANRLLEFLMKHSFHSKRAVFRHNLEIIRTLVECWKECLHVPYR